MPSTQGEDIDLREIQNAAHRSVTDIKPQAFVEYLTQAPLSRAEKRLDRLCREFLKEMDQMFREDLVEEILIQDEQQKSSSALKKKRTEGQDKMGKGRKKQKKAAAANNE